MLPLDDDGNAFIQRHNNLQDWGDDIVQVVSWMMWAVPEQNMVFLLDHVPDQD